MRFPLWKDSCPLEVLVPVCMRWWERSRSEWLGTLGKEILPLYGSARFSTVLRMIVIHTEVVTGSKVRRRNVSELRALNVNGGVHSSPQRPGKSSSNGGGQESHHRPLCSVFHQNNNDKDSGNDNDIEGGKHHRASQCSIFLLPSDGNSVAFIT